MIAITVSTNYDDILGVILPQNQKFFKIWFIITDINDKDTINTVNKYSFENVILLFYDFYRDNKIFNKGGAIRYCQDEIISNLNYEGMVLLLDSDIFLPDNFMEITREATDKDTLYGTNQRYDYHSYKHFRQNIVDSYYTYSRHYHGYFQLYKYDKNKLYKESHNCSECDLQFLKYFSKKQILSDLNVSHLGKCVVNWNKRIEKTDFII